MSAVVRVLFTVGLLAGCGAPTAIIDEPARIDFGEVEAERSPCNGATVTSTLAVEVRGAGDRTGRKYRAELEGRGHDFEVENVPGQRWANSQGLGRHPLRVVFRPRRTGLHRAGLRITWLTGDDDPDDRGRSNWILLEGRGVCGEIDRDGDGLLNLEEDSNGNGWLDRGETDPKDSDTDDDLVEDGLENSQTAQLGSLPTSPTEGNDHTELDFDGDGDPNATDPLPRDDSLKTDTFKSGEDFRRELDDD